jgi:hypothetical protein
MEEPQVYNSNPALHVTSVLCFFWCSAGLAPQALRLFKVFVARGGSGKSPQGGDEMEEPQVYNSNPALHVTSHL